MSTIETPPASIDADFLAYIDQHRDRAYDLHAEHMNPAFVKMLRTIGYDRRISVEASTMDLATEAPLAIALLRHAI